MSPATTLALLIPLSETANLSLQALLRLHCLGLQYTNPFPTATNQENKTGEKAFFISFIELIFLVVIQCVVGAIYIFQSSDAPTGSIWCD